MDHEPGRRSFLLSISLAELAFILLFLVLLLSIVKSNLQAEELSSAKDDMSKDKAELIDELGTCREANRKLTSQLESFQEFMQTLKDDERLPADWMALVRGYKACKDGERSQEALEEENERLVDEVRDLEGEIEDLERKLTNSQGQLLNCQRLCESTGKGFDHPPCWADATTGKTQYLYRITVKEDTISVEPRWPASREKEALGSEIIQSGLGLDLSNAEFRAKVRPILDDSKRQNPECRHFVFIVDEAVSKEAYKTKLLMTEDYFYKYLSRRR